MAAMGMYSESNPLYNLLSGAFDYIKLFLRVAEAE
jgi:hypothetical protein